MILPYSQKGLSSVFIIIGVVVIGVIAFVLFTSKGSEKISSGDNQQTASKSEERNSTYTASNLKSVFSNIEDTYSGNIPWANINTKQAFQFYPKELKGLTLPYVSTNHDNNYNPLTVFKLTDSVSIPMKNSYISYYEVPNVLRDKFKLSDSDIAFPIELKVYEFDRQVSEKEKSIIVSGENFKCTNDKSKPETTSFSNQQIVFYYCNTNLTSEQKAQASKRGFFDKIYEIYFPDRNLLIQFSADSAYIDNPQDYLSDYLSKLFNSNNSLFITQDQIQSVEQSRKFEEWRSKTFDKK